MTASRTAKIAVVQPRLAIGEVEANLLRCEDLVRDAHREHSPDVVILPEAASSPNLYHRALRRVARPVDGAPFQLYTRLARELDCVVGGGFHAQRGNDVYGTYVLAEPDGAVHLHDKDIPTAWENNYYRGGDDDGVTRSTTLDAPVALACGWEWARNRTARRVRGRVQLLVGGMCWPTVPRNWGGPARAIMRSEHETHLRLARALPGQMARLIGAPVAIASHVGDVRGDTPLMPGVAWDCPMIGESQICERDGSVLARLTYDDGEGHAATEVVLAPPVPLEEPGARRWIPDMTAFVHGMWHPANLHGAVKYRAMKALRRHPWQATPSADLPDEIPPSAEPAIAVSPRR